MGKRVKMSPMSIIVAVDSDGGFGKDGKIPWHFPEDFKHFKEKTKDSICIMGRKTYEDMLQMVKARKKDKKKIKEILPGRECYVVTSNEDAKVEGATVVPNIREAVQRIDEDDKREVFILGGRRMYIEGLSWANKVYMTVVKGDPYDCDVFFPIETLNRFTIDKESKETDELYFITYTKQ